MGGAGVSEVCRSHLHGLSEGLAFRRTLNVNLPAKALGDSQQGNSLIGSVLKQFTLVAMWKTD